MLQTILTSFGLVLLAELGDKTQLAVLALASRTKLPWAVFIGAGSALLVSTGLAVALGTLLTRYLPASATRVLHYVAGSLLVVVGAWTIWKA
ncbi:TMEM165/GDT1 family protein [Candidatus Bipolaricaulota bacterium]